MIGIYKITNLVNKKVYIGQSVNLSHRKHSHFSGWEHNRHLKNAYNLYGADNFVFEYLKTFTQEEYAKDPNLLTYWEAFYISQYDARDPEKGYNLREAGPKGRASEETKQLMSESLKGHVVSDETRQKLSAARKGQPSPMKGKHHSEATLQKLSELKKGNTFRRGQRHSAEAIQKMSKAHKGATAWNKGLVGVVQVSEETRQKHSETAKRLGLKPPGRSGPHSPESIQKMRDAKKGCKGRIKTEEEKRKISEAMKRVRAEQKARKEAENAEGSLPGEASNPD